MPFKHGVLSRAPFPVSFTQQVAAATLLTSAVVFANPSGGQGAGGGEIYEVLSVEAFWDVVSTSGTLDVRNVPAATAITGGATLLTGTLNLAATARAVQKGTLVTSRVTRQLLAGSVISVILGGTLTGLVGLNLIVWLQAIRGVRAR